MRKVFTLAIVVKDKKVLLGRRTREHGRGFWNGFGGGVEAGETIEAAACRECEEEVGITPMKLDKYGVAIFEYADKPRGATEHEVHVFRVSDFAGTPIAKDEVDKLMWFPFDGIPYNSMWPDDCYWLPLLLADKHFTGRFAFDKQQQLISHKLREQPASINAS